MPWGLLPGFGTLDYGTPVADKPDFWGRFAICRDVRSMSATGAKRSAPGTPPPRSFAG